MHNTMEPLAATTPNRLEYWRKRRAEMTNDQKQIEKKSKTARYMERTPEDRQKYAQNRRRRSLLDSKEPLQTNRKDIGSAQKQMRAQHQQRRRLHMTAEMKENLNFCRRKLPQPSKYVGRDSSIRPAQHYLGKQGSLCQICGARHFAAEKTTRGIFSSCCEGGTIRLKEMKKYPEQLTTWLQEETSNAKNFRTNIRKYNSAFAFASFKFESREFKKGGGPPVFAVHGQVYHLTATSLQNSGSVTSEANSQSYAELYILDPEFANSQRVSNEHNSEYNPYANAYKMMSEVISSCGAPLRNIEMWITKDRQFDMRRYNLPTVNEVAAVFVSEDGQPPFNRDIRVYPHGKGELQHLSIISPNCDPMTYPMLFPFGDPGWQPEIEKVPKPKKRKENDENKNESKSRFVSMLEFYSYRLQERLLFNPLLHAGKLTHQYIVDAFLKVEGQRLEWNKMNQKKLRVDLYMGLMDYVNSKAEQEDLKPGRIVILPSSFTGSKRSLQQNYQDAMILVAKFGKPDLFITFTCNPNWKEIQDELGPNEKPHDRPDLIAVVFNMKLKELFNDLTCNKGGVLGKVKAFVYVIEFQKRGLPHCHMLIILDDKDKLRDSSEVDSVVCAEIPDPVNDPELHQIVTSCMVHGPCGELNRNAPCMEENKGCLTCSKNFPKEFVDETNVNVNGYPLYRRRNNGKSIRARNGTVLDNRWIVPYNPYLSRKYNAHINVEICSSIQSVKYIFKYIYKGHDSAIVQISEGKYHWDEIRTFINARYIAAPEAIWRLRKYELAGRSHAIIRLPVHLPLQQLVYFDDGEEEKQLQAAEQKGTKLTKWFYLNKKDLNANKYLYCEIPYHYVWKANFWEPRKCRGEKVLPRMYSVSPSDMERFCLRLLLTHIKGAKSFECLKTINGITYGTFSQAAKALGLLDDDTEWEKTMEEATVFRMPCELRLLFATILVNANPTNSLDLYLKYKEFMEEDYSMTHSEYMAEQQALYDIQQHLLQFGKDCNTYGLPTPVNAYNSSETIDLAKEKADAQHLISLMNSEQKHAFDTIYAAVHGNVKSKCFYLSGAGGCGKTFVYKALTSQVLSEKGWVKSIAPTGLAATLLKGGKTVHSGFGIPLKLDETTTSTFTQGTYAWKELIKTNLIIWDEISMCHVNLLKAVDRSLRILLNRDEPFGGIVIVVGGDFQQQAPVVQHGTRVEVIEACVKSCSLWRNFTELRLTQNMRVNLSEKEFASWLLEIGSGMTNAEKSDFVKLSDEILVTDIVNSVFGNDINSLSPDELASRAVLCPKNSDTLIINERVLDMLEQPVKTYFSVDKIGECESEEERAQYPIEFLNSLTPAGLPQHALNLKKGCCVMLLRNLNPKRGLCNGTRLIVESLGANVIECSIYSGERKGQKVLIPRISLDTGSNSDIPFKLCRKQFPLRLAYSLTITKSQGQTFDRIGVYLQEPVFTHGQLYTAFSRVKSKTGLTVEVRNGTNQGNLFENDQNIYTYNCVYREILA